MKKKVAKKKPKPPSRLEVRNDTLGHLDEVVVKDDKGLPIVHLERMAPAHWYLWLQGNTEEIDIHFTCSKPIKSMVNQRPLKD